MPRIAPISMTIKSMTAVALCASASLLSVVPSNAAPTKPAPPTISSDQRQIANLEATILAENHRSEILSQQYDAARSALALDRIAHRRTLASIKTLSFQLAGVEATLQNDAINAYVDGSSADSSTSTINTSALTADVRQQYQITIAGDLSQVEATVIADRGRLSVLAAREQIEAKRDQRRTNALRALAISNTQAALNAELTVSAIKGRVAAELAAYALAQARAAAAAAVAARTRAAAEAAAANAAAAGSVAASVGGSAAAAAAAGAVNAAAGAAGGVGSISGSPTASGQAALAVSEAIKQLGVPYVWGGEMPGVGFDCSGLVQWAWGKAGVGIPRTTESQWPAIRHVRLDALRPGDLLYYFNLDGDHAIDHVVMYIGSGPYGAATVLQAPHTGAYVSFAPVWTYGLAGAARP